MFERYTEKARRVIFFARYEASYYGSNEIDTEHLFLGVLREDKGLSRWISKANSEIIRQRIENRSPTRPRVPTHVDMPLSSAATQVLKYAADEAELLAHRHIGTEHLFLGLFDEVDGFAAKLLREAGVDGASIRRYLADLVRQQRESLHFKPVPSSEYQSAFTRTIEIHGIMRNPEQVREAVQFCRMYNWHWQKLPWHDVDIVIDKNTGRVSFDLGLAQHSEQFELVKGGWKKDHCCICRWELFQPQNEADADHGSGYTTDVSGYARNATRNSGSTRAFRLPGIPTSHDSTTSAAAPGVTPVTLFVPHLAVP